MSVALAGVSSLELIRELAHRLKCAEMDRER